MQRKEVWGYITWWQTSEGDGNHQGVGGNPKAPTADTLEVRRRPRLIIEERILEGKIQVQG